MRKDLQATAEYNRRYYSENRERYYAKAAASRQRFNEWFSTIKDGLACKECGETHPACLQFHHRNPAEKEHTIASLRQRQSRRLTLAEMAKCDVLCANCHFKLHWNERHS